MLNNILYQFKFYRKYKGGKWYYIRAIWDFGRNITFFWSRYKPLPWPNNERLFKTENY
jgi:hypothetical protein